MLVAGFALLWDPNSCGVDCLATNQSNQLVDVITVTMTKMNIKTFKFDFLWHQYSIFLKIATVRNIKKKMPTNHDKPNLVRTETLKFHKA